MVINIFHVNSVPEFDGIRFNACIEYMSFDRKARFNMLFVKQHLLQRTNKQAGTCFNCGFVWLLWSLTLNSYTFLPRYFLSLSVTVFKPCKSDPKWCNYATAGYIRTSRFCRGGSTHNCTFFSYVEIQI